MNRTVFIVLALILLPAAASAGETISGTPQAINATSMIVANKTIHLFGVKSPKAGTMCTWKSKRVMDCGKLATAGLKDITVASKVTCTVQSDKTYVCKVDGFDLAYGLIHAGWAVPTPTAPKRYFAKRDNARANKRGLWRAIDIKGQTIGSQLK